jgi:hypothetical protein
MNMHTYLVANVVIYLALFSIWNRSTWYNLLIKVVFGVMTVATVYLLVRR